MERLQSVRIHRDTSRTSEQQRTRNDDGVRSSLSLRRPSGRQRPDRHLHNIRNQFYHRDGSPEINNNIIMRNKDKFFEMRQEEIECEHNNQQHEQIENILLWEWERDNQHDADSCPTIADDENSKYFNCK